MNKNVVESLVSCFEELLPEVCENIKEIENKLEQNNKNEKTQNAKVVKTCKFISTDNFENADKTFVEEGLIKKIDRLSHLKLNFKESELLEEAQKQNLAEMAANKNSLTQDDVDFINERLR